MTSGCLLKKKKKGARRLQTALERERIECDRPEKNVLVDVWCVLWVEGWPCTGTPGFHSLLSHDPVTTSQAHLLLHSIVAGRKLDNFMYAHSPELHGAHHGDMVEGKHSYGCKEPCTVTPLCSQQCLQV